MPSTASCTTDEKIPVSLTYTTAGGRPAAVQGQTEFIITFGEGTFERTGDHSGFLVSGDLPGDTEFVHVADADLGEGVVSISDTALLTVGGAMAAAVGVSYGAPVAK